MCVTLFFRSRFCALFRESVIGDVVVIRVYSLTLLLGVFFYEAVVRSIFSDAVVRSLIL